MTELMANHGVAIIVGAVLALFGFIAFLSYKRRKSLAEFAMNNGMVFDPEASALSDIAYCGLPFFNRNRATKSNLLRTAGPGAGEMLFFDYSYTTGGGKHRSTHRFGAAMLTGAPAAMPAFELRPENFLDRLAEMAGFKDIDLPQVPGFSKAYRLTGEDQEGVAKLFASGPAAFLQGRPGLIMNGGGGRVVLLRRGYVSLPEYPSFVAEARAVFTSFLSN